MILLFFVVSFDFWNFQKKISFKHSRVEFTCLAFGDIRLTGRHPNKKYLDLIHGHLIFQHSSSFHLNTYISLQMSKYGDDRNTVRYIS